MEVKASAQHYRAGGHYHSLAGIPLTYDHSSVVEEEAPRGVEGVVVDGDFAVDRPWIRANYRSAAAAVGSASDDYTGAPRFHRLPMGKSCVRVES